MPQALRERQDSQDLVQEALLAFFESAPRFEVGCIGAFRALLLRIARNVVKEEFRNAFARCRAPDRERRLTSGLGLPQSGHGPATHAVFAESDSWVRLGMHLIEDEHRQILVQRDYENRSFTEIGTLLGITPDAARMRRKRALLRLSEVVWQLRAGRLADLVGDGFRNGAVPELDDGEAAGPAP